MTNLNLKEIREMNEKRLDGYWKHTIAALCDEVEHDRQMKIILKAESQKNQEIIEQLMRNQDRLGAVLAAARAWARTLAECNGVAAAEQALLAALLNLEAQHA